MRPPSDRLLGYGLCHQQMLRTFCRCTWKYAFTVCSLSAPLAASFCACCCSCAARQEIILSTLQGDAQAADVACRSKGVRCSKIVVLARIEEMYWLRGGSWTDWLRMQFGASCLSSSKGIKEESSNRSREGSRKGSRMESREGNSKGSSKGER